MERNKLPSGTNSSVKHFLLLLKNPYMIIFIRFHIYDIWNSAIQMLITEYSISTVYCLNKK